MPHSSGGGSAGGGFHSGGSSGGSSGPRMSHRPYPGAHRYVYYHPGYSRYETIYYEGRPQPPRKSQLTILFVVAAVMVIIGLFQITGGFNHSPESDLNSYSSAAVISDHRGILGNDTNLRNALEDFRLKTGVAPAIEIVDSSEWEVHYDDLESFAYDEYVTQFDDEMHWLFVISYPDAEADGFIDWSWQGMIGDDVTLSGDTQDLLQEELDKNLRRMDSESLNLADAIADAFNDFNASYTQPAVDIGSILSGAIFICFAAAFVILGLRDYRMKERLYSAVPVPYGAGEITCPHCGGVYIEGSTTDCPYCGTPALMAPVD